MRLITIISILLLLFSCSQRQERIQVVENNNLNQKQIDSVLDKYNFEYESLIFIDSTQQAILPITTQKPRGGSRLSSKSYEAESYPQYWNIIFYNIETGHTNLLTKSKMRISNYHANLRNSGPIISKSIIYKICDTDYDNDNQLTYKDPEQLFISVIDGSNLTRLSPLGEQIMDFQIVPDSDKIIFSTQRDTNEDLEFDKKDELIWYLIDLSKESKPIEIINKTERKEIENLYFKQWLVKNKK
ncbi:TolB-like translocation protein [Aequorivita antarctica]|uniref:Lipoprotein n=1 Tax=Aequorivita antarctica TaxID=153266 RepID=A0A5C6YZ66_9FLAO|nr:hypothetical protein [Aequorivita antarctica]TXD72558.1 hypothetical protein ESU54_12145 [Aequorivita antarctica]SRX75345.1 hypothetical protein AEQU3_02339 [Aequorivita antarctica]